MISEIIKLRKISRIRKWSNYSRLKPSILFSQQQQQQQQKSSCILLLLFIPFTNFSGTVKLRGSSSSVAVAMKMLQPVQPGPGASQSAQLAWQGAQGKWARDPLQYSSKAYCTARQELNILLALRHPNIVPLVGESKMCRNDQIIL